MSALLANEVRPPRLSHHFGERYIAAADDQCPDVGDSGSSGASISMKKTGASGCTVSDGDYVVSNTSYTFGMTTSVTGWCQQVVWDPVHQMCVNGTYSLRSIGTTYLYDSATYPYYFGSIGPSNFTNIRFLDTTSTPPVGTSKYRRAMEFANRWRTHDNFGDGLDHYYLQLDPNELSGSDSR